MACARIAAVRRAEIKSDVESLTAADLVIGAAAVDHHGVAAARVRSRGELTAATDHHGRRIAIGHNEDPRHDPARERLVEPFQVFHKQ